MERAEIMSQREDNKDKRKKAVAVAAQPTKPPGADYLKLVEWREEDGCFVGSAPPLITEACHGDDPADVYRELCVIIEEWLDITERDGRRIPARPSALLKDDTSKSDAGCKSPTTG